MIKWPGKIAPRASNEMVSMHDFFPTLAGIIGAKVPTDRPIDGVDQGAFFTGKQAKSNRESLITFIGEEVVAVRWRQYRIYPKQFVELGRQPGDVRSRRPPRRGERLSRDLQYRGGPARGGECRRHHRLGDRPSI